MRAAITAIVAVMLSGCTMFTTPEVVYQDLALIRENVEIQKDIAELLLTKIVIPKSPKQVQAIALQKVQTEERWEYIAHAINRIIMYLEAERYVDYAIFIADYTEAGEIRQLLDKAKGAIK